MKTKLYAKGYLIRVTSGENDGDNYNTKEVHETNEQKAKAIVEFCKLFESRCGSTGSISNMYEPDDEEMETVKKVFDDFHVKHPNFFDDVPEKLEYYHDWFIDFASALGLSGSEYYTRVCESVEVLYFDQDVYAEDMTAEFSV